MKRKSKGNNSAGWTLLPLLLLLLLAESALLFMTISLSCLLAALFISAFAFAYALLLYLHTHANSDRQKVCKNWRLLLLCVAYFYARGVIKRFPRCYAY